MNVDREGVLSVIVQLPHLGRSHGRVLRNRVIPPERHARTASDGTQEREPQTEVFALSAVEHDVAVWVVL